MIRIHSFSFELFFILYIYCFRLVTVIAAQNEERIAAQNEERIAAKNRATEARIAQQEEEIKDLYIEQRKLENAIKEVEYDNELKRKLLKK